MRRNKVLFISVAVLLLVTVVVAVIHLNTREVVPAGALRVEYEGRQVDLFPEQLELGPVQGTVVNGKGETLAVEGQGILLATALTQADVFMFREIQVIADDGYSAVIAEEAAKPDRVYLLREEDSWRLVVFGDTDSRRNVRNVVRVVVS